MIHPRPSRRIGEKTRGDDSGAISPRASSFVRRWVRRRTVCGECVDALEEDEGERWGEGLPDVRIEEAAFPGSVWQTPDPPI